MGRGRYKKLTDLCKATANIICAVVHGNGITEIQGQQLWRRGDVVVVPARDEHRNRAMDDAVLFRVTDAQS
jgi:gentisate 1,2-dioxygenase